MVAQHHEPASAGERLEGDLHDLPGGVASHDHVEEHGLVARFRHPEQVGVVEEGDVDPAGVVGVGVHHLVPAGRGQGGVHPVAQPVDDEPVLDLADAEQVRSCTNPEGAVGPPG
nr:hypothetical protein [Isoptericola jiangsuensis]